MRLSVRRERGTSLCQPGRAPDLGCHFLDLGSSLYFAKGSLYLVGEDLASGVVKTFSLPRMKHVLMLDETYEGNKTDPAEHFKDSFGVFRGEAPTDVKLSFAPTLAPFIKERSWHRSQRVIAKGDGSIDVLFHVAVTPELKQWVLGFGTQVTVIEPVQLRDAVLEEAGRLVKHYARKLKAA